MLVDSHCHLNMPELVQDLDKIVFNAKKNKTLIIKKYDGV